MYEWHSFLLSVYSVRCLLRIYILCINMRYKPDHHNICAKLMVKLVDFETVLNYKKKLQCALDVTWILRSLIMSMI